MAADEIIDNLVDRGKVKSDIDFVNELLEKVLSNVERINKVKLNIGASKGMADAAKAAADAAKAAEDMVKAGQKVDQVNAEIEKSLQGVNKQWLANAADIKENIKLQIQYESELKKVKSALAAMEKAGTGGEKVVEYRQKLLELKLAIQQLDITTKTQTKSNIVLEGSMAQMSAELGNMRALYRQLTKEERESPWGKQLLASIAPLDAELKRLDGTIGNFQRNVGNYKSGFNGLGMSINQILREFPAFTFSIQTGLLALSNNFPILFDEIAKTTAQVKALRAEGQKVPGTFAQIAKNLLSFQTFLNIGVFALTVWGPALIDWISGLFKSKKALDAVVESQRILNSQMAEGSGAFQNATASINELKINIDLAKQGLLSKTDVVKQYNEGIGKTVGQVKSLEEVEDRLTQKGDAYIKMMLFKAAANLAMEEAAKKAFEAEQQRQKQVEDFITTGSRMTEGLQRGFGNTLVPGVGNNQNNLAEANRKLRAAKAKEEAVKEADDQKNILENIAKKFQQDAAKIAKDNQFDFFADMRGKDKKDKEDKIFEEGDAIRKANYEIQRQVLEDTQRTNEQIVQSDQASYDERRAAAEKYLAATQALRKLEFDYSITDISAKEQQDIASAQREYKNEQERRKAIQYIRDSAAAQRNAATVKYNSDEQKINDDYRTNYINKLLDFLRKEEEARLKHEDNLREIQSGELKNNYDQRLANLDKQYAAGLLREDAYNKKKLILQYEYGVKSLKQEIEFAEQRLEIARKEADANGDVAGRDKVLKLEQELAALRIKLEQKVADFKINQNKRGNDAIRKDVEALATYSRLAVDLFDQAGGLLNARYEREKNKLQEQIDLLEKKRDTEIEAIKATTASEEEKAARIAQINATADSKKTQLEQKQRLAQQKQARFDKAINIATIIQETAVAVIRALGMKPWTPANIALAAGIGALGAAKLAVAVATPIPQYAEGTGNTDHPGGPAIVGDGGKKELVVTPSGKSFVTPDKSTLVNLPKGTKVFPDANEVMEVVQHMAFKQMPVQRITENNYSEQMVQALMGEMALLRETVKNKETVTINATRAGLSAMHKQHNNFWEYIGTNVR